MRNTYIPYVRRLLHDESGQILMPWVAVLMLSFFGISGLIMDVGRAYVVHAQLQNAANAAALAAAGKVFSGQTSDDAYSTAFAYSASSGDENASGVGNVTTTVYKGCVASLLPKGSVCAASTVQNAVQVVQSTTVRNYFMPIFWGSKTTNVSATATATPLGTAEPWNVAIVIDSTGSMNATDNDCGGVTEFQCALNGVQAYLQAVIPTCPQNGPTCAAGSIFRVALFTFPNVRTDSSVGGANDTVQNDYNCGGTPGSAGRPIAEPYTLPLPGGPILTHSEDGTVYMSYTQTAAPNTQWYATYQITPFLSDYYDPNNASSGHLNTNSNLVKAIGYGNTLGCLTYTQGILNSGFGNTYFASSIYSAQIALAAQKAANPGSQNAIIFLSDGQANNSMYGYDATNTGYYGGTNQGSQAKGFPQGACASSAPCEVGPSPNNGVTNPGYLTPATLTAGLGQQGYSLLGGNGKGIYPDWYDQCQQAIAASQYAAANGVDRVYGVAYGPETTGCSTGWNIGKTDLTVVATGTLNSPIASASDVTTCSTMQNIASNWAYFFVDNHQTGNVNNNCTSPSTTTTPASLSETFKAIAATFTGARMLPNNAFLFAVQQSS